MLSKDVKVPKFNIRQILTIKSKVVETLMPYEGSRIQTANSLDMLTDDLSQEFPMIAPDTIKYSLQPLTTGVMNTSAIEAFAIRFGAHYEHMTSGKVLLPFSGLSIPTWSVIEITKTMPGRTRSGKPGGKFTFRVLTGLAAGEVFEKVLSVRQLKFISMYIGFNKKGPKMFDGARSSMFGLRLAVQLINTPDGLDFDGLEPRRCLSYNRTMIEKRFGSPCHKGLTQRCSQCLQGTDQCFRACRLKTLVEKPCTVCNEQNAIWDGNVCLMCNRKAVLDGK